MDKKKPLRIMLADDESIIRLDLKEMLVELGHEIAGEAPDGETAVEMAQAVVPDLIIMDIKMPGLDGLQALAKISAVRRIPTVMLTAYSQPDLVEQAVGLGVFAYLVKPIKEADLLPTLEVAMARSEELQAVEAEVRSLEETLATRKLVEKAKGILMAQSGLNESAAFRKIQKLSMDRRKPIKDIAEAIILAADMNLTR